MGVIRKNNGFKMNTREDMYRVAVHEIGHTFMALYYQKLGLAKNIEETEQLRKLKETMEYTPESFLSDLDSADGFLNKFRVHKVTILPVGQSLGHTAFMNEDEVLSSNKLDLIKFIGNNYIYIYLYMCIFVC